MTAVNLGAVTAYALAVKNGFEGTEQEWLASFHPRTASVTLPAAAWTGENPYTQSVTLTGITAQSKVDLQPDATVLAALIDDGVNALYIANDNGSLTAYAVGAAPKADMTVQATVMEVNK